MNIATGLDYCKKLVWHRVKTLLKNIVSEVLYASQGSANS